MGKPANRDISDKEIAKLKKFVEKKREPKTDAAAMEKTYRENPEKYKYYRAFFQQKGGKDWENWQNIEEELGITPQEIKPLPRFRTIKGGKE